MGENRMDEQAILDLMMHKIMFWCGNESINNQKKELVNE